MNESTLATNPRFLSGSTGALDPTSIRASLTTLLHGVLDSISVLPALTRPLPLSSCCCLLNNLSQPVALVAGLGLHRRLTPTELRFLQDLTDRPIHQHNPMNIAIDKRDGAGYIASFVCIAMDLDDLH